MLHGFDFNAFSSTYRRRRNLFSQNHKKSGPVQHSQSFYRRRTWLPRPRFNLGRQFFRHDSNSCKPWRTFWKNRPVFQPENFFHLNFHSNFFRSDGMGRRLFQGSAFASACTSAGRFAPLHSRLVRLRKAVFYFCKTLKNWQNKQKNYSILS